MNSITHNSSILSQIEHSSLVDGLPYIDSVPEALKQRALELITSELAQLAQCPKPDYLSKYPKDFLSFQPIEVQDFRVALQSKSESEYDVFHIAKAQAIHSEYLQSEKLNLQVMNEFTEVSYQAHLQGLQSIEKKLEFDLKNEEQKILEANRSRKALQEANKEDLANEQETFKQLAMKNHQICKKLQEKAKLLDSLKRSEGN